MATNKYNEFIEQHHEKDKRISNVEFTLKNIDNAMGEHTGINPIDHPDKSVTVKKLEDILDLQQKTVYVRTPESTSSESEFPDTGGELSNTYTRQVIDSKLGNKSDIGHNHTKSDITDFPVAVKNPQPLTINGMNYDGSSELSIEVVTTDVLNSFGPLLASKADYYHSHTIDTIADINDFFYNKPQINEKLSEKSDTGHTHLLEEITNYPNNLATTEYVDNEINGLKNIISALTERIDELIVIDKKEPDNDSAPKIDPELENPEEE